MKKGSKESVPLHVGNKSELASPKVSLSPARSLGRFLKRRSELAVIDYEARIEELTPLVVNKLCRAIIEGGMVSLFHDRTNGNLNTELYQAFFSSEAHPQMFVRIVRHDLDNSKLVSNFFDERFGIAVHDEVTIDEMGKIHAGDRSPRESRYFGLKNTREMPAGKLESRFSIGDRSEGFGGVVTAEEKVQFLEDILETELNVALTVDYFGAPYTPGGMRPSSFHEPRYREDEDIFSGYWVRDIVNQLPALPGAATDALLAVKG